VITTRGGPQEIHRIAPAADAPVRRKDDGGQPCLARSYRPDRSIQRNNASRRLRSSGRGAAALAVDVQGEGLLERAREGDDAVLAALALGDADAAGVEIDVGEPEALVFEGAFPGQDRCCSLSLLQGWSPGRERSR
jgi:hypothetical protein